MYATILSLDIIVTWEADGFRCAQLSGLAPRKELSQTQNSPNRYTT